jgi:P4 family phage/plasmid primase-like protien
MADERDEAEELKLKPTPLRLATQDGRLLEPRDDDGGRGGGGDPPGGGGAGGGEREEIPTFASEDAMANVLIHTRLNGDWRYGSDGRWYHFDGRRWAADERLAVFDQARHVCRATSARIATAGTARLVSSAKSIAAVERISRSDPSIATPMEMFDRDPWSLNTPDGIVELRTGELLPHDRNRLCTRLAGASPSPMHECKQWRRFLKEITGGDRVFEDYLQRLVGYSLLGITPEEIFVFIYGPSNTGKSKFVEVLRLLHGDYGAGAPMDTFEASQGIRHPTDLAGFVGRRLVTAAETEEGRRWDQQRLTMLTGRDRVRARFVNKNFFEYAPQFLLVFHGNYRPRLGGVSEAMRRRLHLLPFHFKPVKIDKHLIDKLKAELPGIMAWAIEGCLNWQREGLTPPPIVTAATEDYFKFEDMIGEWIDERCDLDATHYASSRELHRDFSVWMQGRGFIPNENVFVARLEGIDGLRRSARLPNNKRGFWGIALKRRQADLLLDHELSTSPTTPR